MPDKFLSPFIGGVRSPYVTHFRHPFFIAFDTELRRWRHAWSYRLPVPDAFPTPLFIAPDNEIHRWRHVPVRDALSSSLT
jgi:hypothetical protein